VTVLQTAAFAARLTDPKLNILHDQG